MKRPKSRKKSASGKRKAAGRAKRGDQAKAASAAFLEAPALVDPVTGRRINPKTGRPERKNFTEAIKAARFAHCGGRCEWIFRAGERIGQRCNAVLVPGRWHADHAQADANGGAATFENCRCLCTPCHVEFKTPDDRKEMARVSARAASHAGVPREKGKGWPKKPDKEQPKKPASKPVRIAAGSSEIYRRYFGGGK